MRHLGCYLSIFTVPNFLQLDHSGLYYGTPGRKVGIFSARHNSEAKASFFFSSPPLDYDRRDVEQQKNLLRRQFADEGWEVPKLLRMMDAAPDFYFDSVSQVRMDRWSAGRSVLVGDAAWCAWPLSGMGTGLAIVGAYILAGELKQADGNYPLAFARYESQMREYAAQSQKLAEGAENWFVPRTRWRLWLSTQMWRILPYTPWKNMMLEVPLKIASSIRLREYAD